MLTFTTVSLSWGSSVDQSYSFGSFLGVVSIVVDVQSLRIGPFCKVGENLAEQPPRWRLESGLGPKNGQVLLRLYISRGALSLKRR